MSLKLIFAIGTLSIAFCLVFILVAPIIRADDIVVNMRDFYEGDLVVDGFELKSKTRLSINAIGAELKHSDDMYAYGWIIDANSREPIWVLDEEDTKRYHGPQRIRQYEGETTLPAGKYEVYYYAGRPYFYDGINISIDDLDEAIDLLGRIFDNDEKRHKYYTEDIEDLMMLIEAPASSFTKFDPVTEHRRKAIVDFSRVEDDSYETRGFTLKKDIVLKIIAVGEYSTSDRVFVDFGWIIDADSRKKVWQMDKWNTSWAGGGRKNRAFVGEVELPAGNYVAYFASDDSHSFGDWNVAPPYDPLHYGMVIYPANEDDIKHSADFVDDYTEPVIAQITKVRNYQYKHKGFTLKKESNLHIIALGEYGYDDEFVDYGWIESLEDNEIVWEMTEDNTGHGGGASKNRRFDGIVTLPAGSYMVYYIADDSHAYRRWNDSAPFESKMWGITIYGAGRKFDTSLVEVFDEPPEDSNVLVNLTGIGDDEEVRQLFELDSPHRVHIFALGEGKEGSMFDYGWIEDAETGEVIWEMTYRKTRHAGGGRKNRMVDIKLFLEAGKYYAYFETDDSHSFPDFNTSRPNRPQKWGITITLD